MAAPATPPSASIITPSAGVPSFVHLHVHTHYSMLDGACRIGDLVKRAKALNMPAMAITDHGAMHGVVEFFNECKKEGIQPILGMEAYIAPGDRRERSTPSGGAGEAAYHLLLLAQNLEGYQNLVKLSSIAFREGFYYKPRIDKEVLREYSKGLIGTSACLGGEVASSLMKRDTKTARKVAETYADIFGPDRFFIEVQKQGIKEQDDVNPELVEISKKLGVGVVGTNDVHFLMKEDHFAHDVLCCISMGRLVAEEGRMKYPTELYLKSPQEMNAALGHFDGAMDNTLRIAQMCKLDLDFSKRYSPVYRVPAEKLKDDPTPLAEGEKKKADDERYMRQLCEEGLVWRYGTADVGPEIRTRLNYEMQVIAAKNFCSYFLIVWDFCNFARERGIPVGARGSGVGTMVGYLLGLCNVDPLKYGLLFERFMDPSRNEMPDIDIDICQDGRQSVIEYVRNKYGHVAQIITFGTLAAKAVCKDVGRVLGVPLAEVDKINKLIPTIPPGITLEKALRQVPELQAMYEQNPVVKQIIDVGKRLEGLCRNAGCHAAGVIIADQPLDGIVPLYKDTDGNVLTQFEGPIAEKCGLLKMDFLGLRTLTVLTRAVDLVKQTKGITIDLETLELADKKVYELFCRGETKGVFQFESGGMQDLLMKMKPDRLEDLIAANALYRPGPMELIPSYCLRKHGLEKVPKIHPVMDKLLAETYGIMVYQEQVMQIFNQLGGIELSAAYKLIKAISKKTSDVIAKYKPEFLKGTMDKGVSKDQAEEIFEHILKFGGYGFNKSHSSRYAIVAFQTAYMKVYHPIEYMAALLTYEMGSTEKIVEYIEECKKVSLPDGTRGIKVLPPDINYSNRDFTPVYLEPEVKKGKKVVAPKPGVYVKKEGLIRFGLTAVRGVGDKAVQAIIEERKQKGEFTSIFDFCERVDTRTVQRSTLDALVRCGGLASVSNNRAALAAALDRAYDQAVQAQNDKRNGQFAMFGGPSATGPALAAPSLPDVKEHDAAMLLQFEKELLGFYITSHPLTEHQAVVDRYATANTREALTMNEGQEVMIGGLLSAVRAKVAKSGRSAGMKWAILEIEDLEGKLEGMCFAETFADVTLRYPNALKTDEIVFIRGKIDRKRETPSLLVNDVIPMEAAIATLTTHMKVCVDATRHSTGDLATLRETVKQHKGNGPLYVELKLADGRSVLLQGSGDTRVRFSSALVHELQRQLGSDCTELTGEGERRRKAMKQAQLFKQAQEPVVELPMEMNEADAEMELAAD